MQEILFYAPHNNLLRNNLFFQLENNPLGQYGYNALPAHVLKQELAGVGYDAKTIDLASNLGSAKAIIFLSVPKKSDKYYQYCLKNCLQDRMYLVVDEPSVVNPENYKRENHLNFRKVLTWFDQLVDNKKYFKYFFPAPVHYGSVKMADLLPFEKRKLVCMIAGNKYSRHPNQLYTERLNVIRYLERAHPAEFDLYGTDWDIPVVHHPAFHYMPMEPFSLNNALKKICKLTGIRLRQQFPSSKSVVLNKKEVLGKYLFTACYENQDNTQGYVTEKIIDPLLAGAVPVYYGSENLRGHIPEGCYINSKKFSSFAEVYEYIHGMGQAEYSGYIQNIKTFITGPKFYPFTIEAYVEVMKKFLDI